MAARLCSAPCHRLASALSAALLVVACGQNEAPDDVPALPAESPRVSTAAQALEGAHVPTLDPATLNGAEIRKLLGDGPHCAFRYTSTGRPVLVASVAADGRPGAGVVKLNGTLVPLEAAAAEAVSADAHLVLTAAPLRLVVQRLRGTPPPTEGQQVEANMLFEVGQRLKVDYGGFLTCRSSPRPAAAQR
jgi:hypothetical protein